MQNAVLADLIFPGVCHILSQGALSTGIFDFRLKFEPTVVEYCTLEILKLRLKCLKMKDKVRINPTIRCRCLLV